MASSNSDLEASKKYFQENGVLVNLLGISDRKELEFAEATCVEQTLKKVLSKKAQEVSKDGLKQMHKEMFGEVYSWAGEFRDYTTGRGDSPFCVPTFIDPSLDKIFAQVNKDLKPNMPDEKFVKISAEFIGELNAVHPFVDGNGRTQRQMLKNLSNFAKKDLMLENLDREKWYKAAENAMENLDYSGFEKIISESLKNKKTKFISTNRSKSAELSR